MDARETILAIYRTASERELTVHAAAFAYYAFVSLIPLVLLALVVGSLLGGERVAARLVLVAGELLPAAGEELLVEVLTTEAGRAEATLVAVVVAGWGALKVFRGLSLAFDRIYGTVAEKSFVEHVVDGIAVIVAVAGGLVLMIVLGYLLGAAPVVPFGWLLGWFGLFAGLTIVFFPIYYLLPPIEIELQEALPGTVVAAIGWTLLQAGFQLYAANAARYEAYGAVGAVILLVTWLYFAGIVILLGAVVNVVRDEAAATA